ncbi:MAG: TlpA family protein disulfide reductase [Bacteroidetes bacterium]|nr:TlpA family protein disulfide reductase [Bacteroidota bacterium]
MKKLLILGIATMFVACNNTEVKKDYVTFSGKIENKNSDSIVVSKKGFKKVISANADGTFSDTLKVEPDFYTFYDGGEYTGLFLKNGYDLTMSLNTEKFDESVSYVGDGAVDNNFIADKARMQETLFDFEIDDMDEAALDTKLADVEAKMNDFVSTQQGLDPMVTEDATKSIGETIKGYKGYLGDLIALRTNLPKGAPSPTFSNYENHAGGETSLTDLQGKYVYIDVWATWCGPCKAEIPHLKKVETDYHDKNIEFVSVSIDRPKDHDKWISMVNDKELGGVQLYADNNWESKFVKDYFINGIPRFILVDPQGNIVTPDAPRPSDEKLRSMLDELI